MKKKSETQPSLPETTRFISGVRSTIEHHRMFSPGDHVVVGVSGGADSVALLLSLHELQQDLKIKITVAHLNHGLRPEAARREADFVAELARRCGLPCICETRDVRAEKNSSGACLQEAARAARYGFFDDVRRGCNAQKLALGHTMDDQAETVLLRLLRGASTRGLGGIPPVRTGGIVRPLINSRRRAIERFVRARGCDFIADTSAHEPQYLRNRIRHELLPVLARDYNPRIVEALCTTAGLARDDEALLQATVQHATAGSLHQENDTVRMPVSLLDRQPLLAGRIIRSAIETVLGTCRGLTRAHIEAIAALTGCTGSGKRIPLPGGLIARREYEHLVIGIPAAPAARFHVQVDQLPADIVLPAGGRILIRRINLDDTTVLKRPEADDTLHLSAESISMPLVIRSWAPGDRIRPFGSTHSKKVKAVFAEHKVPMRLRGCIPLLTCGDRIISVGALCLAEHCRVQPGSSAVIALTIAVPVSP